MQRRKFSCEYKLEAAKLVRERCVSVAQAARGLDVHENFHLLSRLKCCLFH